MSGIPIIVGYDGSPGADLALAQAMGEGFRLGSPVRVVHVLQWPTQFATVTPGPMIYPDEASHQAAEDLVRGAVLSAARDWPTVPVTGRVRIGATVAELVAESTQARMLMLGHRDHRGLSGWLLGSVGVAVSAQAHCPVVIIRGRLGETHEVLTGFDGSPCASRAIGVAFQAAAARGAAVHVLHAWHPLARRRRPADTDARRHEDEELERIELAEHITVVDAIQVWRRRYPRVPVTVELVADGAGHALIAASCAAQLVVVGSCGHGGLRGLLFGSVSRQLVHHADCPVVVVRELPENEVSPATA